MSHQDHENYLVSFPSPFQRALDNDSYTKGKSDFSVTQLISAPKRTELALNNEEQRDPYASFMALLGTAVHKILEEWVREELGEKAEVRLYHTFKIGFSDVVVSGQLDFYEKGTISDYKITGGIQDKAKPEHYKQAQMNGFLAQQNGWEVNHVSVVYVQRDWSYFQSKLNPKYPQTPFKVFTFPYEEEEAKQLFITTVTDHLAASMGNSRPCTPDEKWEKPTTYALMKLGGKRASKVCVSMAEAEELKKPGQFVQVRPGEQTFCNSFCGYKHCCPDFKRDNAFDNTKEQ